MYVPAQRLRIGDGRVELDGSSGEGGGQIVRTACALSALTGVSCRISRIRARRSRPGLRAQHCTALKGLARLCDAKTSRLKVGATEVIFSPGTLRPVELELDTGTAGSIGLVLQSLLLAGIGLSGPWKVLVRGGTDVPNAPSCDYIKNIKLVLLAQMGYRVNLRVVRRGYFPKGGGIVQVEIQPPQGDLLEPLHLPVATDTTGSYGVSHASSGLSAGKVAERQRKRANKGLTDFLHIPSKVRLEYGPTDSTGFGLLGLGDDERLCRGRMLTGHIESTSGAGCRPGRRDVAEDVPHPGSDRPVDGRSDPSVHGPEPGTLRHKRALLDPAHAHQYVGDTKVLERPFLLPGRRPAHTNRVCTGTAG